MAFTRDEFLRGAAWALGSFVMLLVVAEVVLVMVQEVTRRVTSPGLAVSSNLGFLPIMLGYTVLIGGSVAAVCMLIGATPAYLLARSLRRVRSIAIHVAAFTAFGAVFGGLCAGTLYAALLALDGTTLTRSIAAIVPVAAIGAAATAAACAIGWAMTARRAYRRDHANGIAV